jgi:tellurite resistance protein TehA-like permease
MKFSLNWWAFIFPNAGLTIALVQIADVLRSNTIKGICSAMTILLVVIWVTLAFMTVRAVWMGNVLWPGMDEDMEDVEGHEQAEDYGDGQVRLP